MIKSHVIMQSFHSKYEFEELFFKLSQTLNFHLLQRLMNQTLKIILRQLRINQDADFDLWYCLTFTYSQIHAHHSHNVGLSPCLLFRLFSLYDFLMLLSNDY